MNVAYNMDCMEAMRKIPDKYFDLAVVDPPYGIGESGKKNKYRTVLAKAKDYKPFAGEDRSPPAPEYFRELIRVSKNQIIFGANHFVSRLPEPDTPCWIVWDKVNGQSSFADVEMAWTSFRGAARLFRFMWHGMMQGKSVTEGHIMQGNKKLNELRIHPTQKPIALYTWIFSKFSGPGEKVLDTHLGSGSSRIAAHDVGLDFVGFEIDSDYFAAQEIRYRDYISQVSIKEYLEEKLPVVGADNGLQVVR